MRAIFGFLSVLLALWLVASVVKSQLSVLKPSPTLSPSLGGQTPQQVQQQFKASLDRAMLQQARPDPDSAPGAALENKP